MHRHNGDTVQSSSDTNHLIISSSDEEDSGTYTCLFNDASYSLMVAIRPTSAANMGQYNYHIAVDMTKKWLISLGVPLTVGILVPIVAVICTIIVTATVTFCISYLCFKRSNGM